MKTVKIRRMVLHYFKGAVNREIEFGDTETVIAGPNGCGKSTVMDAFFWCLWGKNAAGQSDQKFAVKTVDGQGVEIPHIDHEVEITLDVDGDTQVFRRTLTPKYDKEGNLMKNETTYVWNEVPMKQSEYNAKVALVIDEGVFKLVASPFTFLSMPWNDQRKMLMRMAGDVSDAEVAGTDESLTALVDKLTGKTLDELRRETENKLKRVNEQMQPIPARIDEVRRGMPEAPDMDAIAEEEARLKDELSAIEKAERDEAAAINLRNADRNRLAREISELEAKAAAILREKEAEERNAIHMSNAQYNEAEASIRALRTEEANDLQAFVREQASIQRRITTDQSAAADIERRLETLRGEWTRANAETFQADEYLKCPLYGITCQDGDACARYDSDQGAAFEMWQQRKQQRLAELTRQGQALAAQKAEALQDAETAQAQLDQQTQAYERRKAQRDAKIQANTNVMGSHPKRPLIATVKGEDIPEWVELDTQIREKQAQLDGMQYYAAADNTEAEARKTGIREQLTRLKVQAGAQDAIDKAQQRVDELEAQLADLGDQKAKLEYQRQVINDFEIRKTELIGSRVNSMFKVVRWQMFQRQINGEEVPACICLCDGVRYNDTNDARKMDAGIDIASTIGAAYGISAPIFIDNSESYTNIYDPHTMQRILLRVENIPAMRIDAR